MCLIKNNFDINVIMPPSAQILCLTIIKQTNVVPDKRKEKALTALY